MAKLYNLARVSTSTIGTGTITLGAAVSGFLTFAQAGIADGDIVSYGISDGSNSEVGTGTYTSSGTTLTRTVGKSTNSNSAISLSGSAQVYITARAEDVLPTVTTHGDSIYTILANDKIVATSAALTASRTWTLPAASALSAGQNIIVSDSAGGVTATNTLIVTRAGSDTIDGATSITINKTYGWVNLVSDGTSKWKILSFNTGPTVRVYTSGSSATETVPAGAKTCVIEAWGGGGGGGGSTSTPTSSLGGSWYGAGGGGAGGGYSKLTNVNLPATYTYTVGAAGSAGSANSNGGAGGTTSVTGTGVSISCTAGGAGTGATDGNCPAGGAGGAGSGGDENISGGRGGSGTTALAGVNNGAPGVGGSTPRGGQGGNSAAGLAPGGGGSGGQGNGSSGSAGAAGQVVFTYTY